MTSIFPLLTRARVGLPLGLLMVVGFLWWGSSAAKLALQLDGRAPSSLPFREAAEAARSRELYVRVHGATLDCDKELEGEFGRAYALADGAGEVAAMVRLPQCGQTERQLGTFEGVFAEPPYLLYGEAVDRGWRVTPGNLAYLDPTVDSAPYWKKAWIGAFAAFMALAYLGTLLVARQAATERANWRLRALGFLLLTVCPWFSLAAHDYVYLDVVPVPLVAAIAALLALPMVFAPGHPMVRRLTAWSGTADDEEAA